MSEPTIPTVAEIQSLPRWARVAFAARCLDRVRPKHLVFSVAPDPLAKAIGEVERLAATAGREEGETIPCPVRLTDKHPRFHTHGRHAKADTNWAAAPGAARFVLSAAGHAVFDPGSVQAIIQPHRAAVAAAEVVPAAVVRADYDRIRAAAEAGGWTDETPVPPDVFGPL